MAQHGTFQMPDPMVSEKEKDEDYHKRFVQALVNRSVNANFDLEYSAMTESYRYYQGTQSNDAWEFMQTDESGSVLPATWINYNSIKNRVDNLVGDFISRGYEIYAETINKDSLLEKAAGKQEMEMDMRMAPDIKALEDYFNFPLFGDKYIPKTEEELDEFWRVKKSDAEIVMTGAMNIIAKQSNWDYERIAMFRDVIITNRMFAKNEIVEGMPQTRRIDPRFMIYDRNSTDDMLTDSSFWGEIRYMNIGDAATAYNMSKKEIEEAYSSYQEFLKAGNDFTSSQTDFGAINPELSTSFFKEDEGHLRVLVATAYWVDFKIIAHKEKKDKYGNDYLYRTSDKNTGDDIKKKTIKVWRKGTLIGGKIFKEWGLAENQTRDVDNMATTTPPYFAVIPNYLNSTAVSKVQQIKGLQDLKNIALYNMQLDMTRAGSKGFIYDIAQIPEGWDFDTVIKYVKNTGITVIDSMKDGMPANYNQFSQYDLTLSSSVEQYIKIAAMVDDQINKITGVSDERQGVIKNASQAVGVTQAALAQSSMTTEVLFQLYYQTASRIFNHLAGLVKITWPFNKSRFIPLIGTTGINFLEEDIALDLSDYNVYLKELPPAVSNHQNFQAIIMASLQSGAVSLPSAMQLLLETNVREGLAALKKEVAKGEAKAQEMQQQQQQAEAQMQQQQQQANAQMQQQAHAYELDKINAQGQWTMKSSGLNSSTALSKEKIDFAKKLELEKIKERSFKRSQGK
jgi:hypothetical protein